jgi:dihydropyrimidinase
MTHEMIVRGGRVWFNGALADADVAIDHGLITAVGTDLGNATDTVDATARLVLPGGIDVHTHFDTDLDGSPTADDYESGTRAAAFGGLTTVLNYAFQAPGERLCDVIDREQTKAQGSAYIDYGFHVVITDSSVLDLPVELTTLLDRGCPSIKVFTAMAFRLTDDQLLDVLAHAGGRGILVNVHAEDGPLIDHLTRHLLTAGHSGIDQLGLSRPPRAEALAVEKMVSYAGATRCPLYVVHLSSADALDAVRRGRAEGIEVYVETRPAYLYLDEGVYSQPDGERYACWPPIRAKKDRSALWDGLSSGDVQTYATDHTTWTLQQKLAPGHNFSTVPGGIANVQTSIGMLFSEGVQRHRLSLRRFVEVVAETPARLFGLWPRKGTITAGSDADLMLIDPELKYRIHSAQMQSASDFDPYDGFTSHGWPIATISRGQMVVDQQQLIGDITHGEFMHRKPFATVDIESRP